MYKAICFLGLFLLGCLSLQSHAQEMNAFSSTEIVHFSWQTYQAQRQNWSIAQHPETGFIYAGNSGGLLEYDGACWRTYSLPQKQVVRSLHISKDGKIYTGGLGEFGFWKPDTKGKLIYHSLKNKIPDVAFRTEEVWNIVENKQGIFFQSFAYLYRFDGQRITQIPTPGIIMFAFVVRNELFLEVIGKGLFRITPQNTFEYIPSSLFLGQETVHAIIEGNKPNEIWIGTQKNLYIWDGTQFRQHPSPSLRRFIQQNQLNTARKLRSNAYFWGSILAGGILTDSEGKIVQEISKKQGLQNNTILASLEDKDGLLWLALDNGIALAQRYPNIRLYEDLSDKLGTIYDAVVFEGELYVATNHGVFYKNEDDFQLIPGSQGQAWDLYVVREKLFCGHNSGTFLIEEHRLSRLSPITGGWHLIPVSPRKDTLLQGTYTQLCVYVQEPTSAWRLSHTVSGFSAPVKELVAYSSTVYLALTAQDGLHILTLDKGLTRVLSDFPIRKLPFVTSLENWGNTVWVGTEKGLYVFDGTHFRKSKERPFKRLQGISTNEIWGISQEGEVFRKWKNEPWKSVQLSRRHRLAGADKVMLINETQRLIGHENGFSIINHPPQKETSIPNKPFIRSFQQGNTTWLATTQNPVVLPAFSYQENALTIQATTTDYKREVRYAFLLKGGDNKWSAWQENPFKEYTNLPPNTYILYVKTSSGGISEPFSFIIREPWYWNFWSRFVYLLLVAGLFQILYRWHIRRLTRLRMQKEEELRQQEEANKQKLIALRNQQLEEDVIRKSEELANSTIRLIKNAESLQSLKEKLSQLPPSKAVQQITTYIDQHFANTNDEHLFEQNFNQVHETFFKQLIQRYPNVTKGDLKLAAYLRMNLSTKEIAQLLNITVRSVELKRYRLRQKLELGTEENLVEFLMGI